MLKTNRLRADTTVVPGDVGYPTDSGLLARGVVRLTALVATLHVLGLATRTKLRDRSRSMRRRAHDIGAWLRRRGDLAKEETLAITAEMATIAEASLAEAKKVAANARRGLQRAGMPLRARRRPKSPSWTRSSAGSNVWSPRPASACRGRSPRARPGRQLARPRRPPHKERPHRQTGRVRLPGQVVDNEDGIVVDHGVYVGNPPDGPRSPRRSSG